MQKSHVSSVNQLSRPSHFSSSDVYRSKSFSDAKVFQIKRKGAKEILAIIGSQDKYENQYKMIESSFNKILEVRRRSLISSNRLG